MSITIILERPSHPGNVGAVARAMHTMGFEKLMIIDPPELGDEAFVRARGGKHIIENAIITNSLEPLYNMHLLYGTTSRHRSLHLPVSSPKGWREVIKEEAKTHDVAILFGNEQSGLSNELLNLCQAVIEIPARDGHSLNLSHAAQIICYELSQYTDIETDSSLSKVSDREDFMAWLEKYYENTSFLLPHTLTRIRSIINKSKLTSTEVKLLYSLISAKDKTS